MRGHKDDTDVWRYLWHDLIAPKIDISQATKLESRAQACLVWVVTTLCILHLLGTVGLSLVLPEEKGLVAIKKCTGHL